MMYYIAVGITIDKARKLLSEDEVLLLRKNKISVKETAEHYLLYYDDRIIQRDIVGSYDFTIKDTEIISLQSHELHHFQGCLKRVPAALYNSYNDDFGLQHIAAKIRPSVKPKELTVS